MIHFVAELILVKVIIQFKQRDEFKMFHEMKNFAIKRLDC